MPGQHDLRAGADVRIPEPHAMVHRGKRFSVWALDRSMDDQETIVIAFETPEEYENHLRISFNASSSVNYELLEGCDWTAGTGTAFTIQSKNLQQSEDSHTKGDESGIMTEGEVVLNPTGLAGGEVRDLISDFAGYFSVADDESNVEIVLKKNTKYALRITAVGGQNGAFLKANWYELK